MGNASYAIIMSRATELYLREGILKVRLAKQRARHQSTVKTIEQLRKVKTEQLRGKRMNKIIVRIPLEMYDAIYASVGNRGMSAYFRELAERDLQDPKLVPDGFGDVQEMEKEGVT